jgi:hypothetical protein
MAAKMGVPSASNPAGKGSKVNKEEEEVEVEEEAWPCLK